MKELKVYVYWEGDGYDETVDVSNKDFNYLIKYAGEELDEIDDPRIKDKCQEIYEELIDELKSNTKEGLSEDENFDEYWSENARGCGVRISDDYLEGLDDIDE